MSTNVAIYVLCCEQMISVQSYSTAVQSRRKTLTKTTLGIVIIIVIIKLLLSLNPWKRSSDSHPYTNFDQSRSRQTFRFSPDGLRHHGGMVDWQCYKGDII